MNIYLVGFMGTGKSSVGKLLAERLKRNFIDLDAFIEDKTGMAIKDIFSIHGEGYFRQLESDVLKSVAVGTGSVVACGGGIVVDQENIAFMKKTGCLVCLSASVDKIMERVRGKDDRPLLNVPDPRARIEKLLEARSAFYAQADHLIDTSGFSVPEVVEKVLEHVPKI